MYCCEGGERQGRAPSETHRGVLMGAVTLDDSRVPTIAKKARRAASDTEFTGLRPEP